MFSYANRNILNPRELILHYATILSNDFFSQTVSLYCKMKRPNVFVSRESSHYQTYKITVLAATGLANGTYAIFMILRKSLSRYLRIICIHFVCNHLSISRVDYRNLSEIHQSYYYHIIFDDF